MKNKVINKLKNNLTDEQLEIVLGILTLRFILGEKNCLERNPILERLAELAEVKTKVLRKLYKKGALAALR